MLCLARSIYWGTNHTHLSELLREREGIEIGRTTLRRILTSAGLKSPRHRRPPKHHVRRQRMPREGMLIQVDGSHHRWLGDDGPPFALLLAVDDATGIVVNALFCEQENTRDYFLLMRDLIQRCGIPIALYTDRHSVFKNVPGSGLTRSMSEATPAGWAPTDWIGLLSPWRTSMPPASRANLICRGTDCIPSGVTREDRGAFRFRATGGSPSDSKTVTCMMSIWSTITSEREETMAMKNPPHPGRGIRENCLEPLGLSVTEAAEVLGVARHTLSRVLNGHAAISPDMAIRLEKAGWSSADFWLRRQTSYDLAQARKGEDLIRVERYQPQPTV